MRSTKQMSITLPVAMAEAVRSRVDSGDYASESEVIREGLRALEAQERAVEHWLKIEVAAAYDELRAHPERAVPIEDVRAELARMRCERKTEG